MKNTACIGFKIFLTMAVLLLFSTTAPAEDLRMIWANYEEDGNPVYLSRLGTDGWETSVFPPAASFAANYAPCLGIGPDGTSWVIWAAQAADSLPGIYYSRNRGGSWSEPRRVDEGSDRWESTPAVTFDRAGNPIVTWSGVESGSTEIFCAGWEGREFGPAVMVSAPDLSPDSNPSPAVDDNGTPVLVWEGWDDDHAQVFRSRLGPGGWSPEEMIDPRPGTDQTLPTARETGEGRIIVTWREDGETIAFEDGRRKSSPEPERGIPGAGLPSPGRSAWLLSENGNGSWGIYRYRTLFPAPKYAAAISRPRRSAAAEYYIGYGDSITYGHSNGSDTSGWYGSLLAAMLPQSVSFYNKGYPAAECSDLLNGPGHPDWPCPGINSVIDSRPLATRILIMGGTNDVNHGIDPSTSNYYLGQMVDRARAKGVEPLLGTIIPSNKSSSAFVSSWQLSDYYIEPLAESKGCLLGNPCSVYMYYYNSNREYYWSLYEDDGVHPDWSQGDREIANGWLGAFITPTPTSSPSPSPTPTPAMLVLDSGDYDGDSTSDIAVFRQSSGRWAIKGVTRTYFGADGVPASGDFDGDGTTDLAVFRSGLWAVKGVTRTYFGGSADIPAPGDYDGNGTCDAGIYRGSSGLWAVKGVTRSYFGGSGALPVPVYGGAGESAKHIGIFRPDTCLWAIREITRTYFGGGGDQPVPANYSDTPDSLDIGIFRSSQQGLWAVKGETRFYFGAADDRPVPGNYTGFIPANAGIFRPSSGLWAIRGVTRAYFGGSSDLPVSGLAINPSSAAIP